MTEERTKITGAEAVVGILTLVTWIMGVVVAKGFWSTAIAVLFPPWAWYLLAEWAMGMQV